MAQRTVCCGLVTMKKEAVPLKDVVVEVHVQGHVATVTSSLQYVNEEESPLEAVFVFPLPAEAALCHLSVKIGAEEVVASLEEKEKAREQYDDALSSGQQAFLLEESDESPDVFRLSVGSLPPKEKATVTLTYVTELSIQADHALRFSLPAVLNPRYAPAEFAPGTVTQITSVPAGLVPYGLSLSTHVSSPNPIAKVESNCPLDPLVYINSAKTQATVSLSPGHKFDRDVELLLYYQNTHHPTAIVEAGLTNGKPGTVMGDPMIMLSLYPEFPADVMSSLSSQGEFVFLMDRSGSMDSPMHNGSGAQMRIESARDTLLLLLKSLPMGCYFNIYGFGSRHESFFPKSVQYNQEMMEEALEKVREMAADMGGTEILRPLKHIYSQPCLPSHPRQLFIFTDGEVWNTKGILDLVKSNAHAHRCFSFGIGEGASTALISGMAKEGSGHAQFISGTDRMQPKVMQSLRFALQPAVVDVTVSWSPPEGVSITTLPPPITALFQGQRALLYAQLTGKTSQDAEASVTVQYTLAKQPVTNTFSFSLNPAEGKSLAVHRLGARGLIRSLEMDVRAEGEDAEALKKRVVELSLEAGVSSSYTSFIATHKGIGEAVQGPLLRRNVPTAAPCLMMACQSMPMPSACRNVHSMPGLMMARQSLPRAMAVGAYPDAHSMTAFRMRNKKSESCESRMGRAMPKRKSRSKTSDCEVTADIQDFSAHQAAGLEKLEKSEEDPLLHLITLQKASGFWEMESALAEIFGKKEEELDQQMPNQVSKALWATVLALVWLHGCRLEAQEEWQFLAMKAASWIQAQKDGSVSQCVEAGNALLGCQVKMETLGL